ncbi:MAG: hypothetical protein R3B72_08430 [Polyangiaceae bacterium]
MRASRWLSTFPTLGDHKLKVGFARSELYAGEPEELAEALNLLCVAAEGGDPLAREILGAFAPLAVDVEHLRQLDAIRAAAIGASFLATARFLRATTPEGHFLDRKEIAPGAVMERDDGSPLTLGERRALARRPTRTNIDRLMRDPHPMVAKILLQNPRITQDDIVRMAAFRPANPQVVVEIAKAWSHHARIRRTIILNPGTPPAVSVPLLPLLVRPELAEVKLARDLPAVVRATAGELWELRPPMAPHEPPALPH